MKVLRPLRDEIVVELDKHEDAKLSSGGVWVPGLKSDGDYKGTVVAVGPGQWFDKTRRQIRSVELKVGDRIYFSRWAGRDYEIEGVKYKIMSEREVLCVLEKDESYEKIS